MRHGGARFAEAVNWHSGTIRASGRLTVQGAELICGVAEQLHRCGHPRVTVDLSAVRGADEEALEQLRDEDGGLLVLPPGEEGG